MTEKKTYYGDADDLRRRADEVINRSTGRRAEDHAELPAIQRLNQELKVHQVELEMQNEELRRAHQALENSNAKYFDLYDMAPIGYFTINDKGLILEANLAAVTMLGVPRSAFVNKFLSSFVLREDQNTYYQFRKLLIEAGTPQPVEMRLAKKNGKAIWVSMETTRSDNADGVMVSRVVMNDITERKQADENIRETERFVSATLDSLSAHIAVLDEAGSIVAVNHAWRAFYEANSPEAYNGDAYTGVNYLSVCENSHGPGSEEGQAMAAGIRVVMSMEQKEFSIEYPCHSPNEKRWFTARVTRFSGEDAPMIVVAHEAITERKQIEAELTLYRKQLEAMVKARTKDLEATNSLLTKEISVRIQSEEKLHKSENRYRELFEKASEGILLLTLQGDIISVNWSFANMHGYNIDEILRIKLAELNARFDPKIYAERMNSLMTGETLMFEVEHRHKAGHAVLLEVTASMVDLGNEKYILNFHRDVTEKRFLEEQARMNDHLAAMGQISAGIAHEINNPNHIILSSAELLQDIWHDAEIVLSEYHALNNDLHLNGISFADIRGKFPRIITRIFNGSTRINDIVVGMKNYTSSALLAKTERVNMNEVVRDCIEGLSDQIRTATDVLQTSLDEEAPCITGNRYALEAVVNNLVSNALQALADRSKGVYIRVRRETEREMESVIVEVRDEGKGMTSDVTRKATSPFFTTRLGSGGTGLGLSIALAIIKNHNGSLHFQSSPGLGTIATVRLPVGGVN